MFQQNRKMIQTFKQTNKKLSRKANQIRKNTDVYRLLLQKIERK